MPVVMGQAILLVPDAMDAYPVTQTVIIPVMAVILLVMEIVTVVVMVLMPASVM